MKDDEIAKLVNTLRDIAIEFHDHQSLRERIAQVVVPALKADQVEAANDGFSVDYSQGWSDRAALELDAHRDPTQLALRLGICMGALHMLHQDKPDVAKDFYRQLMAKMPASVLESIGVTLK